MRNLPVTIITCCAAATLSLGTASAQSEQSSGQGNALQQAQAQEFFRASNIIGKDTQTRDNQKLGSIKDLVFNQRGEIFALVDIGSSRWAVVPWQSVNTASAKGNQNVQINATQQALKSGPVVSQNQWGALNNPSFVQGVYSYYHVQAPSATATGGGTSPGGTSQGQGGSQGQQQPQQQPQQPQPQGQQQQ